MHCSECHKETKQTHRGMCSARYKAWRKDNSPPNVSCEQCGRNYFDAAPKEHTLCSRACYRLWKIGRDPQNQLIAGRNVPPVDAEGKVVLECEHCGSEFRVFPYELKRHPRYCSLQCNAQRRIVPRLLTPCERCGRLFRCLPNRVFLARGGFCSKRCFEATRRGAKLPRETDRGRSYRCFRDRLLQEAKCCAHCGATDDLMVHHRIRTRERPDLLFDPSNIEVLCRSCHTLHHAEQGHHQLWEATL